MITSDRTIAVDRCRNRFREDFESKRSQYDDAGRRRPNDFVSIELAVDLFVGFKPQGTHSNINPRETFFTKTSGERADVGGSAWYLSRTV